MKASSRPMPNTTNVSPTMSIVNGMRMKIQMLYPAIVLSRMVNIAPRPKMPLELTKRRPCASFVFVKSMKTKDEKMHMTANVAITSGTSTSVASSISLSNTDLVRISIFNFSLDSCSSLSLSHLLLNSTIASTISSSTFNAMLFSEPISFGRYISVLNARMMASSNEIAGSHGDRMRLCGTGNWSGNDWLSKIIRFNSSIVVVSKSID
mmetsp:Transcript_27613/g.77352  ORF Transcript_27613/g.77352 Transcript_27613/m.77352 type:complete len:208 (+) Transcript_27613:1994-2617(+)